MHSRRRRRNSAEGSHIAPPVATRHRSPGFTLVELLVAMLLFDIGLLGIVATATITTRELDRVQSRLRARAIAVARLERLASGACGAIALGDTAWTGGVRERWSVVVLANGTRRLTDSVAIATPRDTTVVVLTTGAWC